MARGKNPYLSEVEARVPVKPYTLEVRPDGPTLTIDPADLPDEGIGLPGSIMAALVRAGVEIEHTCGGVCACSTCHVYVREGLKSCGEATEEEEDMLDGAPALLPVSRLACQTVPDGTQKVVVQIPSWNRNAVREGH